MDGYGLQQGGAAHRTGLLSTAARPVSGEPRGRNVRKMSARSHLPRRCPVSVCLMRGAVPSPRAPDRSDARPPDPDRPRERPTARPIAPLAAARLAIG